MREDVDALVRWAAAQVKRERHWTLIGSRTKISKTLFEVEDDGRRLIGKVSPTQKEVGTYELMKRVWDAGMRPPSRYRIVEPVAWLPERSLLIVEKAAGEPVTALVRARDPRAMEAVEHAGAWIQALQQLQVVLPVSKELPAKLRRCRRELELPRATAVLDEALEKIEYPALVPAHGDCHPLNLYIAENGDITAIDLDTLSMREPAYDVAWFAAHLAIMGHHSLGDFRSTLELRRRFIQCAPAVPQDRLRLHIRIALIRSLHYDLSLLKLKKRDHVEDFLHAAEHGLET